jgi:hypothetical protein
VTEKAEHRTDDNGTAPEATEDDKTGAELVAGVVESLIADLTAARTALEAELALSGMLGFVKTGIAGDEEERAEAIRVLLTQIIGRADELADADALMVLRVCAAVGPRETRVAADAAAGRIARTGVTDRPWATRIGRPTFLRAWKYWDDLDQQASLGVLFDERGREHALVVLVDHVLGGGLKDAWVAVGREAKGLRNHIATHMAGEPDVTFEDIDVTAAASMLLDAVAAEPCPVEDDQVDDIATHRYLVLSRAEHLANLAGLQA